MFRLDVINDMLSSWLKEASALGEVKLYKYTMPSRLFNRSLAGGYVLGRI